MVEYSIRTQAVQHLWQHPLCHDELRCAIGPHDNDGLLVTLVLENTMGLLHEALDKVSFGCGSWQYKY